MRLSLGLGIQIRGSPDSAPPAATDSSTERRCVSFAIFGRKEQVYSKRNRMKEQAEKKYGVMTGRRKQRQIKVGSGC